MINLRSEQAKLRAAQIADRRREKLERKFLPRLAREIRRAGREASKSYQMDASLAIVQVALRKHEQRIKIMLEGVYRVTIEQSRDLTLEAAPKAYFAGVRRKDLEGRVDRLLEEWVSTRSLQKAEQISKTTLEDVRQVIQKGVAEGIGPAAIGRNIREKVGGFSRIRANMIARTETHAAFQNTSLEVVKELHLPGMRKEWVPVEDSRTRSSHISMAGRDPIDLTDQFQVGGASLQFPGDPTGPAREVINCRCVMVYTDG